jgi:hypothetical protein
MAAIPLFQLSIHQLAVVVVVQVVLEIQALLAGLAAVLRAGLLHLGVVEQAVKVMRVVILLPLQAAAVVAAQVR